MKSRRVPTRYVYCDNAGATWTAMMCENMSVSCYGAWILQEMVGHWRGNGKLAWGLIAEPRSKVYGTWGRAMASPNGTRMMSRIDCWAAVLDLHRNRTAAGVKPSRWLNGPYIYICLLVEIRMYRHWCLETYIYIIRHTCHYPEGGMEQRQIYYMYVSS